MPVWELSWQLAAILAAGLFCVAGFARLPRTPRLTAAAPFAGEAGLVVALYALWQYAGSFSVMGTGGAIGRAQWIWNIERLRNCLKRVEQSPSKWRQGTSCFMRFPFRMVLVRALHHNSGGSSMSII